MNIYKINIDNRNYSSWSLFNASTLEPITIDDFNPIDHKLFTNDVFTYNKGNVEIIHSSVRLNVNIPAVLILVDNKTYGRHYNLETGQTNTRKITGGKLLYKCIPDDTRIPAFLVPYEIKKMGFSKLFTNLYVTIHYKQWDNKHPYANLSQTIGSVDVLDNFYEYQLYCKSLNASIQNFNRDTNKAIKTNAEEHDIFINSICKKYPQIEDRTLWKVFTIDPATSLDYDDGFSIKNVNENQILISIYIANVSIWMDSLNLWSSFSQRISTIYLPDRKRPMLPTILSDCLCSLQSGKRRFAFVMDIILNKDLTIESINYTNALIKVFKNFAYEEHSLLQDVDYNFILETTKLVSRKYKYIANVRDSHEVVCYLMTFMNYHCAQELLKQNTGIFRSTIVKNSTIIALPNNLPDDVSQFIKIWNSSCGQYINISTADVINIKHEQLGMDAYVHITSPIRRLVDLLNIIKLNSRFIQLSSDAEKFYDKWIEQIDYINVTMRSIRKVQSDCLLLDHFYHSPNILDEIFDGYCFDKLVRNDGLYQYIVFLPTLKLTSKITIRENLENYEKRQYKLYLFTNEQNFKKKVRLQLFEKCT